MASCLIDPLKEVARCIFTEALWPPVKRHIDYWWCFDGNVQGLRDEIDGLEGEMSNRNQKIEEARLRVERPTIEIENWSKEGTQKLVEARKILQGCVDLKGWRVKSRYLVGKSAKEIAEGIAKLRNKGNSIRIADPAPPASMVPITHAPTLEFQSRKRIEEDVMESLKDDNVRMIAICGAGGIGKTTMAKRIEDRVRQEFDEVVTVVVSQQIDNLKIQKQIAEILRLDLSEETLEGRAHKLRTRLMDSKKKLIIFDDVWKSFKLEDIGVPDGGCKIILTSRIKDECEEMEAKVIEIQVLEQKESWTLFREKAGDCVDDFDLRPIAEQVAAECNRLPIAIVTVGKALQNKKINIWKDALSQLRGANPMDFPQVLEKVYKPLKLSYYFLTESEKSLFLLCCLFPEDYNIRIEDLALLSFGLGMFEGINNIEDGRNRTSHLLERLRSRFLLLTGFKEGYVKMHDVVRDVAIFIGSKEKLPIGFLKSLEVSSKDSSGNCNWMSVDISNIANAKLPVELDFPNLRLLMILNSKDLEFPEVFDVNDICFKGMEELTVLYFSNQKFKSLPSSLKFLKKLRKLHLHRCKVEDISFVGELTSLEILRIWGCDEIEELPANVRELKLLRLLELRDCEKLKRIVAGVISRLVRLEELKIVGCFNKWEAKGNVSEERNASLSELESLRNLTSLEIDIYDPNVVAQDVLLSEQLKRYQIRFYKDKFLIDVHSRFSERKIALYLERDVTVGNWIQRLAKNTQSLALDGDGSNTFNIDEIESLRELAFQNCSTVEKLANAVDCKFSMGSNSFQNLQSINIRNCPNLRYLFSMATARSLVQLENLLIYGCEKMEQVLWNEMESSNTEEEASIIIEFPKLKRLELFFLPNLLGFTTQLGVEIIKFPQLIQLQILECPKLKEFMIHNLPRLNSFVEIEDSEANTHNHHSLHFFCNKKAEVMGLKRLHLRGIFSDKTFKIWCCHIPISFFHDLESLVIDKVDGIKNLISSSIAIALVNLKELWIDHCQEIIEVIEEETHVFSVFQNLQYIYISNCPNLRYLFSMATARSLVQLQNLKIYDCEKMEQVLWNEMGSNTEEASIIIEFPKLKKLKLYKLPNLLGFTTQLGVEIIKFPQLIQLQIIECPKLRTKIDNYPTCMIMIEKLCVDGCANIEEIFMEDGNRHITFQKLRELTLKDLQCLTTFYRGVESIKFPKLNFLRIENLARLNSFVEIEDSEADTHDHHSLHFFCNKKVEIIGLKTLYLNNFPDKISKIWCRHIPISFFHNLEWLDIHYVDGIRNLISSSLAEALVNLKELEIDHCQEIIDVIEEETHVCVNPIFPKLESFKITDNCKLRSFCQWKHTFELPSLEEVEIVDCPLMKTFTLGSLSTPKLHRFSINKKDIEMKDLNVGIHHFISTEQNANEDENNDEHNEDEKHEYSAEDKKEIEGEEKTENSNNNLM